MGQRASNSERENNVGIFREAKAWKKRGKEASAPKINTKQDTTVN
jgi:hypothetical protein